MTLDELKFSFDELEKIAWQELIVSLPKKECLNFAFAFGGEAQKALEANEQVRLQVFAFLQCICFFYLRPDEKAALGSRAEEGFRLEDVTREQLEILKQVCASISDPEMKARVADILWLRRQGLEYPKIAIDSYVASGLALFEKNEWGPSVDRIERALRITISIREEYDKVPDILRIIEGWLAEHASTSIDYFCVRLIKLLLDVDAALGKKYVPLVKDAAERLGKAGQHHLQINFLQVEQTMHGIAGDRAARKDAAGRQAAVHFSQAELEISGERKSHSSAAAHARSGVEVLRRAGFPSEMIEGRRAWLEELQEKAMDEMATIKGEPFDLKSDVLSAIERVKGKKLSVALLLLSCITRSEEVTALKKQVEDSREFSPLFNLIPVLLVDNRGRPVNRSSMNEEIAMEQKMARLLDFHWKFAVHGVIRGARYQIDLEHNARLADFIGLVENNPFVPPGRELAYATGLLHGLRGDILEAAHILIPQFENSIRFVLSQRGVIPSSFRDGGIQLEYDLNTTLREERYVKELETIFGTDTIFDMRALLVSHFGANLRNDLCHGLIDDHHFSSRFGTDTAATYFWWMVLRIVCLPIIGAIQAKRAVADPSNDSTAGGEA